MSEEEKVAYKESSENEEVKNDNPEGEAKKSEEISDEPEAVDYKEKWLRVTAEYQNYRTRTQKEKEDIYARANEKFVEELLDVIDNFERAMGSKPEDDAFADGIELIYKQFLAILEKEHVKEINAKGEKFNPEYHMAVSTMAVEGLESDMVAEVIKKGYTLGDKVIRPSLVVVSQ